MTAPVTHIRPLVRIRRTRMLPAVGEVLVSLNQRVTADQVVAQTNLHDSHVVLDMSRLLGVNTASQMDACLERKPGDRLQTGDIIAQTHGMFARIVRAPSACIVAAVRGTLVALEVPGTMVELKAGMPGVVADAIPDRGVILETTGSLVQGAWGNNQIDQGMLEMALAEPDEELTAKRLDVSMRGMVVLGGHVTSADVIALAESLPLRGLILSSMTADLIPAALKAPFPIVLIEGFGRLSMNRIAFRLLTNVGKREVALNAALPSAVTGERPEIVIPADGDVDELEDRQEFRVGAQVRLHGGMHSGRTGKVVLLREDPVVLENRLRAHCAVVEVDGGEKVTIPLSNLDIIN